MISLANTNQSSERKQQTLKHSGLSDEALMAGVLKRDHQAFYTLAERWSKRLINFFERHLHQPQSAEDLAQEVLMSLWKANSYRPQQNFSSWLYKIARNKLIDYCRKHKQPQVSLDNMGLGESLLSTAANPEEQAIQADQANLLRQAVAELPLNQQTILILSKYQQLDHAQIAEVLNCSKDSVKVMLFRAVKNLSKTFKERYGKDV